MSDVPVDQLPPMPSSGSAPSVGVDQLPAMPKEKPGLVGTVWGVAQAAGSGINSIVPDTLGMPMDFTVSVANLAKAGAGYVASKVTGKAPPAWSEPTDPSSVVL